MERKLKDSGIPGIGAIPEHWEVKRGKSIFQEIYRDVRPEDGIVTCFRDGEVTLRINRRTTGFTESDKEIGYHGVRVGDLVIHQMDAFAGSIGISDSDGKCSPICIVCQPRQKDKQHTGYYCKLLRVMAYSGFIQSLATGIRERSTDFRYKTLVTLSFPVPPVGEQEAIAGYLDEKCGEIDELIEVEQQMITDLEAYRQAVITEAVTRGLNPLAPLRPSAIDWIPQIPEHWQLATIGKLYDVVLGKMLSPKPSSDLDTSESYFCAKDVHFCGINKSNLKEMYFSPFEKEKYRVNDGDLLIVEGGSAGECAIASIEEGENIFIQNSLLIARSKENSVRFLKYFIENLVRAGYISVTCNVATFVHYTKEKVCNTPFFVPPLAEQQAIADYLDAKCGEIAELIKVKQDKIETLKQYRQSLIFEAVTGKINIS